MSYIDEKFKDATPVETVENIIALLRKQGIALEEEWYDSGIEGCYSVRVALAGTTLGTNGKGVTKELARASGHAELMERLQTGYRGSGTIHFNDAKALTKEEILAQCTQYLSATAARITAKEGVPMTAEHLADAACGFGKQEKGATLPYLNVETGELVYFPISLIRVLCSSTGLAAGNSTEEALVQGFSEIVERYCQDRFLREKLTPPTVPDEYLKKFSTAWNIITQTRNAGYTVIIKDCSLGEGYPVVASIVIDPKTQNYRVIFGASPLFEIALERSLTEMYQGRFVGALAKSGAIFTGKTRSVNDLEGAFVAGMTSYPIEFFADSEDAVFQPFPDRSALTNKDLLAWALVYLKKKGHTMFVRDMSHYGFHTYRIYVPGMSENCAFQFRGNPSIYRLGYETGKIACDLTQATQEELMMYALRYKSQPSVGGAPHDFTALAGIPMDVSVEKNRYWSFCTAAYAEWESGNVQQAYRYALSARNYADAETKAQWDYICRVIAMRFDGYPFDKSIGLLERFFEPGLAEITRENFAGNPFKRYLPRCDKQCDLCAESKNCRYLEYKTYMDSLNEVVAVYDNAAKFESLRKFFANLPKVQE